MQSATSFGRTVHRRSARRWVGAVGLACGLAILLVALAGCRIVVGRPGAVRADQATPAPIAPHTAPSATVAVSTPRWGYRTLPSPTPSATPTATPTATATPTPEPVSYVVRKGDTLARIAESFGLTVVEIMAANSLGDPDSIRVGERLLIPGVAATPDATEGVTADEATPEPIDTATPTAAPSSTPLATYTPYPTYTTYPTYTPYPTLTSYPTLTPWPTYTPYPTPEALSTSTPTAVVASNSGGQAQPTLPRYVAPTYTPYPTYTPFPTMTPTHTRTPTPRPTATPCPTFTPLPTYTPYPTFTPVMPVKGPKRPGT